MDTEGVHAVADVSRRRAFVRVDEDGAQCHTRGSVEHFKQLIQEGHAILFAVVRREFLACVPRLIPVRVVRHPAHHGRNRANRAIALALAVVVDGGVNEPSAAVGCGDVAAQPIARARILVANVQPVHQAGLVAGAFVEGIEHVLGLVAITGDDREVVPGNGRVGRRFDGGVRGHDANAPRPVVHHEVLVSVDLRGTAKGDSREDSSFGEARQAQDLWAFLFKPLRELRFDGFHGY